MKIHVKWNNCK